MTLLAWKLSHLYLQAWVLSHQYFSALHILWDWTKYNHNQPSWLGEHSITFKILAYCDAGVHNSCFKISSDLASSKKNHHLGFQQSGPIGVLPCYFKSLTARITEPRRKRFPSTSRISKQSGEINSSWQNFLLNFWKLQKYKAKKTSVYVGASQF